VTKLKPRLTYANVMATIAVFLALGGAATAAITLPKKSVGPKQLKAGAVKTGKIADGAVTDQKLANGAVTEAKIASGAVSAGKLAAGAAYQNVYFREIVHSNTSAAFSDDIQCGPGEQAIGGGVLNTAVGTRNPPANDVDSDLLVSGPIDANGDAVANGQSATGWHVAGDVTIGTKDLHMYAACAQK
jgi:hypothetical protein